MGTSDFALPCLEALARSSEHSVPMVITQPDAPYGRGRKLRPTPVKENALSLGLPVITVEKLGKRSVKTLLRDQEADIIFCAAFGKFLPEGILNLTPNGAVNLHPSKLPHYRGAAPVQRCLMDGCEKSAVTFFKMVKAMDAGDILLQEDFDIHPGETAGELLIRTAKMGADLLPGLLNDIHNNSVTPLPQDDSKATFAPVIDKGECEINWKDKASNIYNRWRGLTPKPGVFTFLDAKRVRVCCMEPENSESASGLRPGAIRVDKNRLLVSTGNGGFIRILEIQMEGKKTCDAAAFINGYKPDGKSFTHS